MIFYLSWKQLTVLFFSSGRFHNYILALRKNCTPHQILWLCKEVTLTVLNITCCYYNLIVN